MYFGIQEDWMPSQCNSRKSGFTILSVYCQHAPVCFPQFRPQSHDPSYEIEYSPIRRSIGWHSLIVQARCCQFCMHCCSVTVPYLRFCASMFCGWNEELITVLHSSSRIAICYIECWLVQGSLNRDSCIVDNRSYHKCSVRRFKFRCSTLN
jgi:hypothetical protein